MARRASQLGITGWVRNRIDGTVEAVVQGEAEAVEAIIDWARQGPDAARVTNVQVSDAEGEFVRFDVLRTG